MTEVVELDALASIVEPQELCISPDGKRVVYKTRPTYIREQEHVQASLWIAELGNEYSARQLTQGDFDDYAPQFSPDGKYLSFLSDRTKPGRSSVLYLLSLEGGEPLRLTSKDEEMGVGAYRWRPDSKAIAYLSADEKSEERKQKEKDKDDVKVYDEDIDFARPRVIDIDTKEVKTFEPIQRHGYQITWNSDGTKLACVTSEYPDFDYILGGSQLHVFDVGTGSSKKVLESKRNADDLIWRNDKILLIGSYVAESRATSRAVCAFSFSEPNTGLEVIAHGKTDCAGNMKECNDEIVIQVLQGLTDILETLDGKELYRVKQAITSWDVHLEGTKPSIVLAESKVGTPAEVFSVVSGKKTQLSKHGKSIADKQIGKAHLCEYTNEDGVPIDGYYAVPTKLETAFLERKPQKTILVVHGGPYNRVTDSFDIFWHWSTYFMALGYLVLCPNYRGGSSHGHDYANMVSHDASQSYQDLIWLIRKGIAERLIDPEFVTITGWSQGGYLSYLSVTRDETFHFRAAIPGAGITHWSSMAMTSDLPSIEAAMSGPPPWNLGLDDLTPRKCSPIYHTQNINTPVLILHGEEDARTPLEQAVGFYRALKSKGKEVTMAIYPGEGHCVPVPWLKKHYVDMMQRIEKFVQKNMD